LPALEPEEVVADVAAVPARLGSAVRRLGSAASRLCRESGVVDEDDAPRVDTELARLGSAANRLSSESADETVSPALAWPAGTVLEAPPRIDAVAFASGARAVSSVPANVVAAALGVALAAVAVSVAVEPGELVVAVGEPVLGVAAAPPVAVAAAVALGALRADSICAIRARTCSTDIYAGDRLDRPEVERREAVNARPFGRASTGVRSVPRWVGIYGARRGGVSPGVVSLLRLAAR